MTYKDFKRELYENILQRKEADGKQIKLLEKHCVCSDAEAMRLVQACNSVLYGRPEVYVREDMKKKTLIFLTKMMARAEIAQTEIKDKG